MRYTKQDVDNAVKRLGKVLHKEVGGCWVKDKKTGTLKAKIGCWDVDYNTTYGGAVIEEITSEGGSIGHPFGAGRRKAYEFVSTVNFAIDAIDIFAKKSRKR